MKDKFWTGFILFVTALPVILGIGYAFAYSLGWTGLLNTGFTMEHWQRTIAMPAFRDSLIFSFYIASVTVLVSGTFAMILAIFGRKAWQFYKALLYVPLTIPAIVMAFFTFQLLSDSGFASRILFQLGLTPGIEGFPALTNDRFGMGILFAHICMATPFFTVLFLQIYENEQIMALTNMAASLGSNGRQNLKRIILPVILKKASPTLALYFIFAFGSYEIPLILGSQSRQMISVFTIRKLQRFNLLDIPVAYVSSIVYTAIVMVALALFFIMLSYQRNRADG